MCYRCGKIGHLKRDCWASDQATKKHKEDRAKLKQNQESHYMELEEELDTYNCPADSPITKSAETEANLVTPYTEQSSLNNPNIAIIDSSTSHTILTDKKYFETIVQSTRSINTIAGTDQIEEGIGTANVKLPGGTVLHIESAIFAPRATRNLISYVQRNSEIRRHSRL